LTWTIGSTRVTRVEERITPVPWANLVPSGDDHLEACRPWIDPYVTSSGRYLLLSVHSFVVETPDTLLVVDTCVGPDESARLPGDPGFARRLAAQLPSRDPDNEAVGFDAVDVVVCTHLHFDHIGWNTTERNGRRVPTFPNARYLVTEAELAAERDDEDDAAYAQSIAPLVDAGCLQPVASDHRIDSWVTLEPSPGHTPGHVSIRIVDGDSKALITGDVIHSPVQLAYPTASSSPDVDPAQAVLTRRRLIDQTADTDILVLGTHFPPPTAGHIRTGDEGVSFS
jgi:glyoxylase-like metal-dependent hydrolase (beta-lactamase superfamily II)